MELKEFIEETIKNNPMMALQLMEKLVELNAISTYINLAYGVELDIFVKEAKRKEGKFWGSNLINELSKK